MFPSSMQSGPGGSSGRDDGPWKPTSDIIEQVQGFLLTGVFPFDYSLPRYQCQICKLRGSPFEMICCDGKLGMSNQPCCGVSFHKVCADPLRTKPWQTQNGDTDNILCDQCYEDLSDSDGYSTEEHPTDCDCGGCESEYVDEEGNLADFVVPDDDPSCQEQHESDCSCEFCTDMRDVDNTWKNLRVEDAPTPQARGAKRAIDAVEKKFGKGK